MIKETSIYTTRSKIRELRESGGLSKTDENLVKVVVCGEDEPVCCDESSDPNGPFCFFYITFFTKLKLCLPFSFLEGAPDQVQRCAYPDASEQLGVYPSFCYLVFSVRHFVDLKCIFFLFFRV